jgi:hypothetical protein
MFNKRKNRKNNLEAEESEVEYEESEEIKVISIRKEKFNEKMERTEYLVEWEDGTISWEPKTNLVDDDGTENIELIRYDIRKDYENNVPTYSKSTHSSEQTYKFSFF